MIEPVHIDTALLSSTENGSTKCYDTEPVSTDDSIKVLHLSEGQAMVNFTQFFPVRLTTGADLLKKEISLKKGIFTITLEYDFCDMEPTFDKNSGFPTLYKSSHRIRDDAYKLLKASKQAGKCPVACGIELESFFQAVLHPRIIYSAHNIDELNQVPTMAELRDRFAKVSLSFACITRDPVRKSPLLGKRTRDCIVIDDDDDDDDTGNNDIVDGDFSCSEDEESRIDDDEEESEDENNEPPSKKVKY